MRKMLKVECAYKFLKCINIPLSFNTKSIMHTYKTIYRNNLPKRTNQMFEALESKSTISPLNVGMWIKQIIVTLEYIYTSNQTYTLHVHTCMILKRVSVFRQVHHSNSRAYCFLAFPFCMFACYVLFAYSTLLYYETIFLYCSFVLWNHEFFNNIENSLFFECSIWQVKWLKHVSIFLASSII